MYRVGEGADGLKGNQKACSVLPTAIEKRDERRKQREIEKILNNHKKKTNFTSLKSPYAQTDIVNSVYEVDHLPPLRRLCRYHYNESDYDDQYEDGYVSEAEHIPPKGHQRGNLCLCYQILSKTNLRTCERKEKPKGPPPILANFPRQTTNVSTALQYYPRKSLAGASSMKRTTFEDARKEVLSHLRQSNLNNNNVHKTTPVARFESGNREKTNKTSSSSTSCSEFPEERMYSPNQPIPNMIEYYPPPLVVRSHAKDVSLGSPIVKNQIDLDDINERLHIIYKKQISEQMRKYIPNTNAKPPLKIPKKSRHKTNPYGEVEFNHSLEVSSPRIPNKRGWKREVINDKTFLNVDFDKAKERLLGGKKSEQEYKIKNKLSYVYIWDNMEKSGPLFAQNPNAMTDAQRKQLFFVRPSRSLMNDKSESENDHRAKKKSRPISKVNVIEEAINVSESTEDFHKPKEVRKQLKQIVARHESISSRIFRADYGIQLFPGILTQASKSSSSNVNPEEKVKFFVDIIINPEFEVLKQHPNKLRCIANKAISKKDEISMEQYYANPVKTRFTEELKETNYASCSAENLCNSCVKCNLNKTSVKPRYYYAYTESISSLRNKLHTTQSRPAEKSKRSECFYIPPREQGENSLEYSNEYMPRDTSQEYIHEKPRDYVIFNKKSREYDNNSRESFKKKSRNYNQNKVSIYKKSRDCDNDNFKESINKQFRGSEHKNYLIENMDIKSRDFEYNNSRESTHKKLKELEREHSMDSIHKSSRECVHENPKERAQERYRERTYDNSKESTQETPRDNFKCKNKETANERSREYTREHKKREEQEGHKASNTKSTKHNMLRIQPKNPDDEYGSCKAPDSKPTKYLRLIQPTSPDEDIRREKHDCYDESTRPNGKSMKLHLSKGKEYEQVVSCLSSKNPYPDLASGEKTKMDELVYYAKMKTKMQRKYYGAILMYDVRPRPLSILMNLPKNNKSRPFLATTETPPTVPRRYKKSRHYGGHSSIRIYSGRGNAPQTKNTSTVRRHFFSGNSTELEEETSIKYSTSRDSGNKEVKTVSSKSIQIEFESSECLKNIRQIRSSDTEAQSINSIQSTRRRVYMSIDELCTPSNTTLAKSKSRT